MRRRRNTPPTRKAHLFAHVTLKPILRPCVRLATFSSMSLPILLVHFDKPGKAHTTSWCLTLAPLCPTITATHSSNSFRFIGASSSRQLFPPALPASSSRELFPPIVTRRIPSLSSIKVMAESAGERLETLSLAGSPSIRAAAIGEIGASARCLRQLSLSKCEGVDDAALDAIVQLRSLESLELSWCRALSEGSIGRLGQISSLRELRIAYTAASDQSIREIVTGANRLEVEKKSLKVEKKKKAVGGALTNPTPSLTPSLTLSLTLSLTPSLNPRPSTPVPQPPSLNPRPSTPVPQPPPNPRPSTPS